MSDTYPLVVIGLDAADYRLARDWECDNLLLDNHAQIETFAHTKAWPITAEVWPVIAKGVMPSDEGVERKRGTDWDGLMRVGSIIGKRVLPKSIQSEIGRYLRVGKEVEQHYYPTEGDHAFSDGVVFNWPEITPAQNWSKANHWFRKNINGEISDLTYYRSQMALTGTELGWAYAMTKTFVPIIGTRCHILDYLGHSWCEDVERLRVAYEAVDELVGDLFGDYPGEVVIISDHGMKVRGIDDEPGEHSWRSMVGTTIQGSLPREMDEVRAWLEERTPTISVDGWDGTTFEVDEEHLRDLGYL